MADWSFSWQGEMAGSGGDGGLRWWCKGGAKEGCLATKKGTEKLEGIVMKYPDLGNRDPKDFGFPEELKLRGKAFAKMRSLRILIIHCFLRSIDLKFLPNNLRYLDWRGYPLRCLPSEFRPMCLVELHITFSNIEQLWMGTEGSISRDIHEFRIIFPGSDIPKWFNQVENLNEGEEFKVEWDFCEEIEVEWNSRETVVQKCGVRWVCKEDFERNDHQASQDDNLIVVSQGVENANNAPLKRRPSGSGDFQEEDCPNIKRPRLAQPNRVGAWKKRKLPNRKKMKLMWMSRWHKQIDDGGSGGDGWTTTTTVMVVVVTLTATEENSGDGFFIPSAEPLCSAGGGCGGGGGRTNWRWAWKEELIFVNVSLSPPSLSLSHATLAALAASRSGQKVKIWSRSSSISLSLQFRSPETSNLALPTLSFTSRDIHIQI
ncbi:hypothetical protein TEA_029976 [Camellia sinensis var. sinensis]|uniref:Uncharacterized protein n=1 Tax=Camellia sinensis var. sinensis TaxID=542762 RepID=A0A4V3WIS2_CAMSN|nr:hypothetical protein TEA_029976 [Camellia sinensis var. sinensis]